MALLVIFACLVLEMQQVSYYNVFACSYDSLAEERMYVWCSQEGRPELGSQEPT